MHKLGRLYFEVGGSEKMIDKLRFAINNTDNPKLLSILTKITYLDNNTQEKLLDAIEKGIF